MSADSSDFSKHASNSNDSSDLSVEETGIDRVKRMYSRDIYGLLSPEMHYLINTVSSTVIISASVGALVSMLRARENYFRQNAATPFESEYLAKRNLVDTMTLKGIRGAANFALKYGSFSSLYLLSAMTVANYHNRVSVYDHIGIGAVMGALFRINFGLKGMLAAGSVGGLLGLFAGSILATNMWYFDLTVEDLRKIQYQSYYELKRKH